MTIASKRSRKMRSVRAANAGRTTIGSAAIRRKKAPSALYKRSSRHGLLFGPRAAFRRETRQLSLAQMFPGNRRDLFGAPPFRRVEFQSGRFVLCDHVARQPVARRTSPPSAAHAARCAIESATRTGSRARNPASASAFAARASSSRPISSRPNTRSCWDCPILRPSPRSPVRSDSPLGSFARSLAGPHQGGRDTSAP